MEEEEGVGIAEAVVVDDPEKENEVEVVEEVENLERR